MHKRISVALRLGPILLAAALAAAGCTGADGTNGTNGTNGANGLSSLVQTSDEPAGTSCPTGGTKLEIGQDTDGDGALSGAEVDQTIYVCNGDDGDNGSNGRNSLVQSSVEPAGTNCPAGGTKLEIGQDVNSDGSLTGSEIGQTVYVCNGDEGATGNQSLLAITDEPAGSNCASGGKKIDYGVDDNANGTLETGEIDGTAYTCDGADGLGSLIAMTTEPPGANCGAGGTKITSGIDDNDNGTLEAGEVDATSYLCNAAPTGTLFLSQDSNPDGLYTLGLVTGQAIHIGATGTAGPTVGLTYDPTEGVLLGSKWQTLLAIAPDGSGVTDRGGSPAEGLAYDYVNNVLYATINAQFFTMDKTNGANVGALASPGVDVEGLAFRADTGTIYATAAGDDRLLAYSIASGTWSAVGSHGLNLARGGLTYDPWNHVLYATGGADGNLYRIDPTTAQATLVGSTGLSTANGGIEYVPVAYP